MLETGDSGCSSPSLSATQVLGELECGKCTAIQESMDWAECAVCLHCRAHRKEECDLCIKAAAKKPRAKSNLRAADDMPAQQQHLAARHRNCSGKNTLPGESAGHADGTRDTPQPVTTMVPLDARRAVETVAESINKILPALHESLSAQYAPRFTGCDEKRRIQVVHARYTRNHRARPTGHCHW